MATTTATRKPRQRQKAPRFLKLSGYTPKTGGVLTIREGLPGKETITRFLLLEIASELGGRGFYLEKFDADRRGDGDDTYAVHVGGEAEECGCRGHLQHGHKTVCRHRAALLALIAAGKLPAA